jgi:hypothetical protein
MNVNIKPSLVLALCIAFLPSVATARITEKAEILDGHVVLTRVGKLNLVVMVDNLPVGGDGIVDQAFLYRSNVALPAGLRDLSGAGTVVVRPDTIIVALTSGPAVSLSVRTETGKDPVNTGSIFKAASVTAIDSGYELSRLYGRKGVNLIDVAFDQLQPRRGDNLFFKAEDSGCISGGPGATDCSIDGSLPGGGAGCSVSCSSNYYACCSLSGCHCSRGGEEEAY